MGLLDYFGLRPAPLRAPEPDELAAPIFAGIARDIDTMGVEQLWREQPHLRTVCDFIARSVASVNLHAYRHDADGGRERVRDEPVARLMKKASPSMLTYDLIYRSLMDLSLYDEFIWIVENHPDEGYRITPISPTWQIRYRWRDPWTMRSMVMTDPSSGAQVEVPAEKMVRVHGYDPFTMKTGSSPVEALKDTLREQLEGAAYRSQLWKSGARLGGVITRPHDAPKWDNKARARFKAQWQSGYTGRGSGAGGTPVLEDGMDFKPAHLKAQDEQVVDMTKLSLQTVASVYHINPTMIGLLDNANYSNVREFRRSLYGDNLGPQIKRIEDALNQWALPILGIDDVYVEFNLEEKLRGSFEEKAAVTSTAVGAPWMTVNEARSMNNLPHIDGGDVLARPLNTTFGDGDPEAEEET